MSLYKKLEWAVRWWALGDALWLPVEIKTYQEIKEQFGSIDGFESLKHNTFASKASKEWEFPGDINDFWYISDDTILTLAWLQSLINKGKIDIIDLFNEHTLFVKKFWKRWFGKWTLAALAKIEQGTPPEQAWSASRWNGVMMKQLPYAFHFVTENTSPEEMDETIMTIARCTHTSPIGVLTAIIHNRLLVHLFKQDPKTPIDRDALLSEYLTLAEQYEQQPWYKMEDEDNRYVSDIIKELIKQRELIKIGHHYDHEMILDTYTVNGSKPWAKRWFHAGSTLGYTRSIFLQNPNREGLLDGIAIGQDTDSQAAIIGNMIGAYKGEFYDKNLIQSLKSKDEIARVLQEVKETYPL